jgi:trehalose synthase
MRQSTGTVQLMPDGTVYSKRKNFTPISSPPLEAYRSLLNEEQRERLERVAEALKGKKILELNATAQGGGVAELLYSLIPFLNLFGIEAEWKTIQGNTEYFECTKKLHNLLQGQEGTFTSNMEQTYCTTLEQCADTNIIDYNPDVVRIHDPQPMGLTNYLKRPGQTWFWRCHIDIEESAIMNNPGLWDFLTTWTDKYDAAIFSAAHYVVSCWPLPKFIIPPFIDPLSEKNRELTGTEIEKVLHKYNIDPDIPTIVQIGRFDPWKGIERTIATFKIARESTRCQLVIAGGLATDDPEGARILDRIYEQTKGDRDIHVLNLSLADRLENAREVNALQRAANVIMQPSIKEGFGLVITEALWKEKSVIASGAGAIPLQIKEGDTGLFYSSPGKTAKHVVNLIENPKIAERMGSRAKRYVQQHFLMPDRAADWLMAIEMTIQGHLHNDVCKECIISFHPWFKMSKRQKMDRFDSIKMK